MPSARVFGAFPPWAGTVGPGEAVWMGHPPILPAILLSA